METILIGILAICVWIGLLFVTRRQTSSARLLRGGQSMEEAIPVFHYQSDKKASFFSGKEAYSRVVRKKDAQLYSISSLQEVRLPSSYTIVIDVLGEDKPLSSLLFGIIHSKTMGALGVSNQKHDDLLFSLTEENWIECTWAGRHVMDPIYIDWAWGNLARIVYTVGATNEISVIEYRISYPGGVRTFEETRRHPVQPHHSVHFGTLSHSTEMQISKTVDQVYIVGQK